MSVRGTINNAIRFDGQLPVRFEQLGGGAAKHSISGHASGTVTRSRRYMDPTRMPSTAGMVHAADGNRHPVAETRDL